MNTKPFVIVDGSAYLYRAFHGLPPLRNSSGEPTGAIFGVMNMLRRLISDHKPEHIVVVFDAKGEHLRDQLYSEYKANRKAMPDELQQQIEPLHKLIRAQGLPLICLEGYEADDVIATLATQASQQFNVIISTSDKDLAQLVNEKIILVNTMTNTKMDIAGVKAKFGIPPELILDYLMLVGDSVDNVPGVEKVGPKTAVKWLQTYGNIENIIEHADEIPGKIGENLKKAIPQFDLTRQLLKLYTDVPLSFDWQNLHCEKKNNALLIELFKQFEFKNWLTETLEEEKKHARKTEYTTIQSLEELDPWIAKIKQTKICAIDTETNSLDFNDAELVGVSIAIHPHEACYIPVAHQNHPNLNRDEVLKKLQPILMDQEIIKIGHNLKYDINILKKYQIDFNDALIDTMLESYVLNSAQSRHDMDSLALKHLGYQTITYEEVAGKGKSQITFDQVDINTATQYAAEDADVTLQLHHHFWPDINKNEKTKHVFEQLEMPLMQVLARMEYIGVLIDAEQLQQQSTLLQQRLTELETEIYTLAGEEFNINSPKQLQFILFEKLLLPILEKTETGQASTAESVLQELALSYPLPNLILEYRSLSKLKSTYTDQLPKQIHQRTGRVHTSYNQAVTITGRLSSTNPNLQNIPIRTEEGRRIRKAFIAEPGFKIVSADYSQIELRLMAHFSNDENLIKAFQQGLDIHQATAAEIFSIPLNEVTSEQRRRSKAINFGLIYGMSAFGLARQINVDRDVAQQFVDHYFMRYPGVKKYMDTIREFAHQQEYVETILGRRLYLPEINSRQIPRQRAAERAAINAPLQGSAAELIKLAMIHIDRWIQQTQFPMRMIMQVHDELIFEVKSEMIDEAKKNINQFMTQALSLNVPLVVDIGDGNNWFEAHD